MTMQPREIASGLLLPEGPVALPDGSLLVVEVVGGRLTRIGPDGRKEILAATGGGPNGAALGPDGKCYICNNGGAPAQDWGGTRIPGHYPESGIDGSIQRVNLETGAVETLYDAVNGRALSAPNDLVFDAHGGFWFTDFGQMRDRTKVRGGLYYAKADGSSITEAVFPLENPNGVGLSPDGGTVYVAETFTAHVLAFPLSGPGQVAQTQSWSTARGRFLGRGGPGWFLDSLAVDGAGHVCVAGPGRGGILAFAPDGSGVEEIPLDDPMTTNICFGGPDLRTAYVTCGFTGRVLAFEWPRAGLKLNYG